MTVATWLLAGALLVDALTTWAALRLGAVETNAVPRWFVAAMGPFLGILSSHTLAFVVLAFVIHVDIALSMVAGMFLQGAKGNVIIIYRLLKQHG